MTVVLDLSQCYSRVLVCVQVLTMGCGKFRIFDQVSRRWKVDGTRVVAAACPVKQSFAPAMEGHVQIPRQNHLHPTVTTHS